MSPEESLPRRNRVDPWGDLQSVPERGLFTGNRGCLVNETGELVRHHRGSPWIVCRVSYRGWRHSLEQPRTWTPLFFLDDAVALAAGHRPCGLCRRADYLAYRAAVTAASGAEAPVLAGELNRRLAAERLRRGRGLERRGDRILWEATLDQLPPGTVVLYQRTPHLLTGSNLQPFSFGGWERPIASGRLTTVDVLTPPTSVAALANGFRPRLHPSALGDLGRLV